MKLTYLRRGALSLILVCATATAARAQSGNNHLALGVDFTKRVAEESSAHGGRGPGLTWRIGHTKTGWGPSYGFSWFATDVDQVVGGSTTQLGELRVRPFMGGYGYSYVVGRYAI